MKTIMHLLSMNSLSGAERVAINIIKHLESEDFHFIYVSLDGPIREILNSEKIEFVPIHKLSLLEVKGAIKKIKPDLIHAHDNRASVIASLSSSSIPIISHLHHLQLNKLSLKMLLYNLCSKKFKIILTVSDSIVRKNVFFNNSKKLITVYNPINFNYIQRIAIESTPDKSDLIFCGRLCTLKNPILFLEIINELKKKRSDITAIIIGDGELAENCYDFIAQNNLQDTVLMKGFVSNPYSFIKQSRILCSTSTHEGFGLVAAEAMILGIPVVATESGGVQEIVEHNKTGFICKSFNEMIVHINNLLDNELLYNQMSLNAKSHMAEFEINNDYYKKINNIYKKCLY